MKIVFIQELIDRIRDKVFALPSVTNKSVCIKRVKDFNTLILGSSQMECGYIPSENEINLSSASMDLYYTYNYYHKYQNENLKNVIVGFSVFTQGSSLIMQSLANICVLHKILCGIEYQYPDVARKKKLYSNEKRYRKLVDKYLSKTHFSKDFRGELLKYSENIQVHSAEKVKERALKHYKNNVRKNSQMEYCKKLLDETAYNNQKLFFVIPPCSEIYREPLPTGEIIFENLYKLCSNYTHVQIINLYGSNEFSLNDFIDGDHLNKWGAEKMTEIIHKALDI